MPLANPLRPLTGGEGYGEQSTLPILGATPPPPNATRDQLNDWLNAQPWYHTALAAWGQDTSSPHLSQQHRAQLTEAMHRAGVTTPDTGIDSKGYVEETAMPTYAKIALASVAAAGGGLALAGALGGGAGGAAATGVNYGPLAAGYGAATTEAAIPGALASVGGAAAGAGTAAATAGGAANVAKQAGSWLTSPYASLIGQGINAIGGIVGANVAAGANTEALKQQQAQFDAALAAQKEQQDYDRGQTADQKAYDRNQYGSYLSRLQPFANTGYEANDRLGQFMAGPNASGGTLAPHAPKSMAMPTERPALPTGVDPPQGIAPPTTGTTPTATAGDLVRMKAPDGSEKDVPADQVAHYQQLGATVLGSTRRIHTMGEV